MRRLEIRILQQAFMEYTEKYFETKRLHYLQIMLITCIFASQFQTPLAREVLPNKTVLRATKVG